ncbi:MAG: GC-type dockerin domain-anchored protein [Planctomycetota bacterium]|nr:GC-type dockerin domain-anchored protein [Planctomycetota bacterium]
MFLRKSVGWCLVAGVVAIATRPVFAQKSWVRFDNGVTTSPGLSFGFDRPTTVFGSFGEVFEAGQPRYAPPTLFCGRATSETLAVGLAINAIAAGSSVTGEPVYLVNTSTFQRLSIHLGEGSVERAFRDGNWSTAYVMPIRDEDMGGMSNLLVRQTGANGGSASMPGYAFTLTNGGSIHNGLIVVACDVYEPAGEAWVSRRAALAYTTVDRLQKSSPWIIAAMGAPTSALDTRRGSPWSYSAFPVGPDEFVAVWTDYRSPTKTGGLGYATRFVRGSGGEWSSSTIRIAESESPMQTEHWHCGGYIKHPDGRESVLISIGDGVADNRVLARTLAFGGAWASAAAIPDTGIDDRSRVFEPSGDWTEVATVWGGTGTSPSLRHNQAISMIAADPECSMLLCGTDETGAAVLSLTYDPDTQTPAWDTVYLPSVTSWPSDGVLNFSMQGTPGGPYFGRIDAAATAPWQAGQRETRILYSPDGQLWGQCMVAGTSGSRQAVIHGHVGYIGNLTNDAAGFRRIEEPVSVVARPLMLSPSTDNLLREVVPAPATGVDSGVTITRLNAPDDLPEGVPLPPCEAGNVFSLDNRSTGGRMGLWRLGSDFVDVPAPQRSALLRAWVYALGPDDADDPSTTAQLSIRFSDDQGERLDVLSGRLDFDAGAWTPFTLWGTWNALDSTGNGPDRKWRPSATLRAQKSGQVEAPSRFLIAWEGVYPDAPTAQGHGLGPQGTGSVERATIDGLDLGDEWTMLLVGMLPNDQWDNRVGGSGVGSSKTATGHLPQLFAIENDEGSGHVRVLADPPAEGIRLLIDDGSTPRESRNVRTLYWLRGSPVVCVVRVEDGRTRLDYSVGGSEPKFMELSSSITPGRVRLGPDAMWWHAVEAVPFVLADDQLEDVFASLTISCPADRNNDGVVDTRDVILFLNQWSSGMAVADFNGDGVVDTRDVVAYLNAYAAGC